MILKDLKMTQNEIYQTCRLLFADKIVEIYNDTIHIMWSVKRSLWWRGGHLRSIYIIEHDTYFQITSDLKRLPSWFVVAVKCERNMSGDRIFKGFKV